MVDAELLLQAPARLEQPIRPLLRDRARLPFALGVQRAAALAQPRAATLRARHEPLRIKLDRDLLVTVTVGRQLSAAKAATAATLWTDAQRRAMSRR